MHPYFFLLLLSVTSTALSKPLKVNFLVSHSELTYPNVIEEKKGKISGVIPDLAREIFKGSPYQLEILIFPSKRVRWLRQNGLVENWVGYAARQWLPKSFDPVVIETPIFETRYVALSHKPLDPQDASFSRWRVITFNGFYVPWVKGALHRLKDHYAAFKFIELNRADVLVTDRLLNGYHIKRYEGERPKYIQPVYGQPLTEVFFIVDRRSPIDLSKWISTRFAEMKSSGLTKKIAARYYPAETVEEAKF